MRPNYSKIWLVVAGTVASVTLVLRVADAGGRIEAPAGAHAASNKPIITSPREPAADTLAGLPGVVHLASRPAVADRRATHSADWIAGRVRLSLWSHRNIGALPTVRVNGSVVTLTGQVASLAQRDLATKYAKNIDGVSEVVNRMVVFDNVARTETLADGTARFGSY